MIFTLLVSSAEGLLDGDVQVGERFEFAGASERSGVERAQAGTTWLGFTRQ